MVAVPARRQLLFAALSLGAQAAFAGRGDDDDVGTSTSGLSVAPSARPAPAPGAPLKGEFVIHNPTSIDVGYSVRWGDGPWKPHKLQARYLRRHWHTLDANGRAPHPQLRFDAVANDSRVTNKTYDMKFGRVGQTPSGPVNQPIEYEFVAQGKVIDLVKR